MFRAFSPAKSSQIQPNQTLERYFQALDLELQALACRLRKGGQKRKQAVELK